MSLLEASRDIKGSSLVGKGSTNANRIGQLDYPLSGRMQKYSVFFKVLYFLLTDFKNTSQGLFSKGQEVVLVRFVLLSIL